MAKYWNFVLYTRKEVWKDRDMAKSNKAKIQHILYGNFSFIEKTNSNLDIKSVDWYSSFSFWYVI